MVDLEIIHGRALTDGKLKRAFIEGQDMAARRAGTKAASTPDELEVLIDSLLRLDTEVSGEILVDLDADGSQTFELEHTEVVVN